MQLKMRGRLSLSLRRRLRGKGAEPLRAAVNGAAAAPAAHAPSFSHHVPSPPASRRTRHQLRRSGVEGVEPPPARSAEPKKTLALHGAYAYPLHEVALEGEEDEHHWDGGDGGAGHEHAVVGVEL